MKIKLFKWKENEKTRWAIVKMKEIEINTTNKHMIFSNLSNSGNNYIQYSESKGNIGEFG